MEVDAVIIGGGVLGSSAALALAERAFGKVVVLDADLSGEFASSTLNVGGVRATWEWPVNIELSLRSMEYFWSIRDEIRYRRLGYLWLYDEERWPAARDAISHQNRYGLGIEALTPGDVFDKVAEIDCVKGIGGATFSPLDGIVESVRIKQHYQRRARELGAEFLDKWFVTAINREGDKWRIDGHQPEDNLEIRTLLTHGPDAVTESKTIKTRVVINAAGSWSPRIAALYGDRVPSEPQRRHVYYIKHSELKFKDVGLIVDTSGAFIQPVGIASDEGQQILCGYANPDEPKGYKFDWGGLPLYEKWVLPRLAGRVSKFPEADVIRGWARLYDNSPDFSGIIGAAKGRPGIYNLHSFCGHGVMQSYGSGQALAELITEGEYKEWKTAGALNPERFDRGELVFETLYV